MQNKIIDVYIRFLSSAVLFVGTKTTWVERAKELCTIVKNMILNAYKKNPETRQSLKEH